MATNFSPEEEAQLRAIYSAYRSSTSRYGALSRTAAAAAPTIGATRTPLAARAAYPPLREAAPSPSLLSWLYLSSMLIVLLWYTVLPAFALWFFSRVVDWHGWLDAIIAQLQLRPEANLGEVAAELIKETVIWALRALWLILSSVTYLLFRLLTTILRPRAIANAAVSAATHVHAYVSRAVRRLRFNQVTDTAYLRYQQATFWIGRHKWQVFFFFWVVWFFSLLIERGNKQNTGKFMGWQEVSDHFQQPIPAVLLQSPKEHGSNSHYQRSATQEWYGTPMIEESVPFESVPVVGSDILVEDFVPSSPREAPTPRTDVGPGVVYCMHCRQWHCCELPY